MKTTFQTYEKGQQVSVVVVHPNKGKFPIGKIGSLTCKFFVEGKKFIEYDSTWLCEVKEVHSKMLLVIPIEQIISASYNRQQLNIGIDKLKENIKSSGNFKGK